MSGLVLHTGKVAPMDRVNVDTDQIIPKQFLKRIERTGFGAFLFYDWRFRQDGSENPDFELNKPENQGASLLVAGHNFGCGSSREHAPWALKDYGFHVIISSSFADIFYNNCLKNGILPIRLSEQDIDLLLARAAGASYELTVDVNAQTVQDKQDFKASFEVDAYWKEMLMNGWDEIDVTLGYKDQIKAFEQQKA
ncbi:3-isopropylmalate dehydratase small subunit [Aureibacillus halotolerans]|uniref:3-isopropylmalate dehydratase small subunit n=1 Tax=Aureibacillus halotolerans TaxID=1508390 RepID=A0A4R6U4I7_9BACI|nr:3-isopropylmalate dehydratase small subunit [Aureibacillus halotolerans]TDQ37934.1 3-isopropylmalate dehydratase small subunit [Aureibacillus halotolerans]